MFPIPVSIVTGFLGSGKTTLLNRLLKDPALKDTAVIINEFGDVGIDHLLVEQSSDGIIELSDGCLCCTVRGELVDTLAGLIDRLQSGKIKALSRVVIETTGLADPAPVLAAIMGHPALVQAFRIDGVVTLVDAVNGSATLDNHLEAVKQVAVADRIVLTKTDLPSADPEIVARLKRLNPGAQILVADGGTRSSIGLRRAGPADADAVKNLTRHAYAKWVDVIRREPRPMSANYTLAVRDHWIDLLEEEGTLVALIEMIPHLDHLLIENLAVDSAHQFKGIGSALLAHAEDVARQVGLGELRLYTNAAFESNLAFYSSRGFQEASRTALPGGGAMVNFVKPVAADFETTSVATLFNCGLYDPATKTADVSRWLNDEAYRDRAHERHEIEHHGHHHHDDGHHHHHDVNRHDKSISAFTLIHDRPIPMASVQMFLELLQSAHGERLLRMKGIICLAEDPMRPLVIHGVQMIMHPPVRLKAWQNDDHRTRLVLITKDMPEGFVRSLFDAFVGKVGIDQPDGDALANNPLAPAGLRL